MKIKKLGALLVSAALCAGMAAPAFAFEGEVAPVEQPVLPEVVEEDVVTVTDETSGALTPEGNLTLVDDYHTNYSDGSGQQFITLVSKLSLIHISTTLKDLSEMLGKETIDAFNTSDTRGNSPSYGTTFQKMGHELLSRDELAVLDGGKCILQLRGVRPFLSDKYDLTQHPNYKLTSDYDPKNTFDIEKYLNRKEKIHPGDEFIVVDADSLPSA